MPSENNWGNNIPFTQFVEQTLNKGYACEVNESTFVHFSQSFFFFPLLFQDIICQKNTVSTAHNHLLCLLTFHSLAHTHLFLCTLVVRKKVCGHLRV